MTSSTALRLFVALPVPVEVCTQLAPVQRELSAQALPFRWTRPEGMHVTLKFLGNTRPEAVSAITRELAQVAATSRPVHLVAHGLGCFPSRQRPRVLWAALSGDLSALAALQHDVELRLQRLGFPAVEGRFQPHVTLGRAAGSPNRMAGRLLPERLDPSQPRYGDWVADHVALVQSTLHRSGSVYTTIHAATLSAG